MSSLCLAAFGRRSQYVMSTMPSASMMAAGPDDDPGDPDEAWRWTRRIPSRWLTRKRQSRCGSGLTGSVTGLLVLRRARST